MIYNIDPNVHGKSNAIFKIFINLWIFKYELLKLLYRITSFRDGYSDIFDVFEYSKPYYMKEIRCFEKL